MTRRPSFRARRRPRSALLLPTGTQNLLSVHQFGLGPLPVALKQIGVWNRA
jgi:hypothetical protein